MCLARYVCAESCNVQAGCFPAEFKESCARKTGNRAKASKAPRRSTTRTKSRPVLSTAQKVILCFRLFRVNACASARTREPACHSPRGVPPGPGDHTRGIRGQGPQVPMAQPVFGRYPHPQNDLRSLSLVSLDTKVGRRLCENEKSPCKDARCKAVEHSI